VGARAPRRWRRARRVSWGAVGCRGGQWRGAWFPRYCGPEGALGCTGAALLFGTGRTRSRKDFYVPMAWDSVGVRCGGGRRTPLADGSHNERLAASPTIAIVRQSVGGNGARLNHPPHASWPSRVAVMARAGATSREQFVGRCGVGLSRGEVCVSACQRPRHSFVK